VRDLRNKLKSNLEGAARIAVLGVGSDLRADDFAGMLVAQELDNSSKTINRSVQFKVFFGHTAPENLSGEIRKFNPSHVVIIDAAEVGKKPGQVELFTPEDAGGISFSTHKLPIKVLAQYLTQSFGCKVAIIGIQPKSLDFDKPVSKEVSASVKAVSNTVKDVIISSAK
jgi:hydrogenase 3 maturation protease